jgi:hypothetical protein
VGLGHGKSPSWLQTLKQKKRVLVPLKIKIISKKGCSCLDLCACKNSFAGAEVRDQKSDISKNKEL